jgi:hypothetical protein
MKYDMARPAPIDKSVTAHYISGDKTSARLLANHLINIDIRVSTWHSLRTVGNRASGINYNTCTYCVSNSTACQNGLRGIITVNTLHLDPLPVISHSQ